MGAVSVLRRMDDQQRLVLLRFHSGSSGYIFAEPEEPANANRNSSSCWYSDLDSSPVGPRIYLYRNTIYLSSVNESFSDVS